MDVLGSNFTLDVFLSVFSSSLGTVEDCFRAEPPDCSCLLPAFLFTALSFSKRLSFFYISAMIFDSITFSILFEYNYGINFKLIDRLEAIGGYDYFYTGEENSFTVSREDEFQDFTVVIEDAEDGDYFKIYGEKDNSIGAFEAYILNRISTSSDDIMVMYDVDIYEFIRTSEIKTFSTTYTQYESFNDPIVFRPVIMNSNIAANFSIEVTMRIYNQTDNTQIVKRASLTLEQTGRYGKKLNKLKLEVS